MNVLHIIPSVSPVRGGPSQAIIEMVAALRAQEVNAHIATTNDNGLELLVVPLQELTMYKGVPTWFFPRFSPPINAAREFAFSTALTQWLWQHIRSYDVLHIHAIFSYASTVAMAIARHQQVPYVVRPLGQLCTWSLQQSQLKKKLYLAAIERKNLNGSAAIQFTSRAEQREAALLGLKASSVVIPHGLLSPTYLPDAPKRLRQRFNLPADEPVLLFLSRLHPKKGLDLLVSALAQLRSRRFTAIIAGSGSQAYEAELASLIAHHDLTSRVCLPGFVEGEVKDLLLQGADVFTLTSYSENFGVAVLEALAASLPAVVTPGVALSAEIQTHKLGFVPEPTPTAIADALRHCLDKPQEATVRGDRARQFILENYAWNSIAPRLFEVYQSIINCNPNSCQNLAGKPKSKSWHQL